MMNENIETMMECLASSVQNNEVTNVDNLTLAINELENFPMTCEILDSSRVGQILQSIRHSKQITTFISERIRSLIKCWRQLLNAETSIVIPNQLKSNLAKTPAAKNGYTNGYVRDSQILQSIVPINGVNHNISKVEEPTDVNFKYKRKSPERTFEEPVKENENEPCVNEEQPRVRNTSSSSKLDENLSSQRESQNIPIPQKGKSKLKSTKELLADFSNFIESDTKNKILMDKISQEDDEPISYFPQDFKMKELIQLSILQEQKNRSKRKSESLTLKRKRADSVTKEEEEEEESVVQQSKCELLLQQFQQLCTDRPKVVLTQFVPWSNLKRGLQMHAPEIKQPPSKQKRLRISEAPPAAETIVKPLSMDIISDLLESFEERAQQKQMVSDAIIRRKEETVVIDNTQSLVEISMKLKLKIPKVPIMKIRRRKIKKRKKKKPKMKLLKPRVKKPRKPRLRAVPPLTNYLDDIPVLPPLPPDSADSTPPATEKQARPPPLEFTEETVRQLAYGSLEGHNCTRHSDGGPLLQLTSMYSHIIGQHYLHVFPWVDLPCPARSTFPPDPEGHLQAITKCTELFS